MVRRSEKKRHSGFSREDRMEAARKGFKDLNAALKSKRLCLLPSIWVILSGRLAIDLPR